jgi:hypothetical protein
MSSVPPIPPRRSTPSDVRRARQKFAQANEANRSILEPLIQVHLTAYDAALIELEAAHRLVADETALALDAETREAALWLVTGRCIGLARAAYALASAGYAVETVPVLRSLHEAVRLLSVFALPGEDALVARWLRGRNVSRGDIMAASHRQEEAARVEMIREGVAPPGTTRSHFEGQYGRWSEFAHHRRRHLLDQVAARDRIMAVGPHPDWRARAAAVDHFGWSVMELVTVGGSALARLLGPEWFSDRFQPTGRALNELKDRVPLGDIAAGQSPTGGTG